MLAQNSNPSTEENPMFTEQELQNVIALIEAGARAVCSQKPMKECAGVMAFAAEITDKIVAQNKPVISTEDKTE